MDWSRKASKILPLTGSEPKLELHVRLRSLEDAEFGGEPGDGCDFVIVVPARDTRNNACYLALIGDPAGAPNALARIRHLWWQYAAPAARDVSADDDDHLVTEMTSERLTVLYWSLSGKCAECRIPHAVFESAERVAEYTHALVIDPSGAVWATELAKALASGQALYPTPDVFDPQGLCGCPPAPMCWGHQVLASIDEMRGKSRRARTLTSDLARLNMALEVFGSALECWPLVKDEFRMANCDEAVAPTLSIPALARALENCSRLARPEVAAWSELLAAASPDDRCEVIIRAAKALAPLWSGTAGIGRVFGRAPLPVPKGREALVERARCWSAWWGRAHGRAHDGESVLKETAAPVLSAALGLAAESSEALAQAMAERQSRADAEDAAAGRVSR